MNAQDTDIADELAKLLSDLSEVQEELLEVLTLKRKLMIQSDDQEMLLLQPREEALAVRLEQCHHRRKEMLENAGKQRLPVKNIRQLALTIKSPQGKKLSRQVQEASGRMRVLQHQSLTNWVLAQRTLLHLSQLLEIIATGGRLKPTYGDADTANSSGSLVDRAV